MATSGRGSGMVAYNVQVAVDAKHHLIVAHEVTNARSDKAQLAANTGLQEPSGSLQNRASASKAIETGEQSPTKSQC